MCQLDKEPQPEQQWVLVLVLPKTAGGQAAFSASVDLQLAFYSIYSFVDWWPNYLSTQRCVIVNIIKSYFIIFSTILPITE
jgi:hypothetical protein